MINTYKSEKEDVKIMSRKDFLHNPIIEKICLVGGSSFFFGIFLSPVLWHTVFGKYNHSLGKISSTPVWFFISITILIALCILSVHWYFQKKNEHK